MSSRLYVGGMSHDTTEAVLSAWLAAHGQKAQVVHLACNRATGQGRGFAFVEFDDGDAAQRAIAALAGFSVEGHVPNLQVVSFCYSPI